MPPFVPSSGGDAADHEDQRPLSEAPTTTNQAVASTPYRVLARKYRPRRFDDLIGQDAVVRTLTNAFSTGRLAHAYMLTGVRGVGKTTTARLIARALNYTGPGSESGLTVDMPEFGAHCEAILESHHPDVIEMDAASKTGIDDVREIIEQVRYRPTQARYKVYIIDEVHMLSKQAFNALLKTLEEPPEHVKFIFATTEIRKVPVTVLSRCQRFDLRRVEARVLIDHLSWVAEQEAVEADADALRMIARAAEGSVRDALSLLDQAVAYGGRSVPASDVQAMLGLSDRTRTIDLFDALMRGRIAQALEEFEAQRAFGSDPYIILSDLAEFVHWVTRLKVLPEGANEAAHSQSERERGLAFAGELGMASLARAWQMLLKGLSEVSQAPNPAMAAEMVLVRIAYAAELPEPATLAADLAPQPGATRPRDSNGRAAEPSGPASGTAAASKQAVRMAPQQSAAPAVEPSGGGEDPSSSGIPPLTSFAAIVALAGEKRDIKLKTDLERSVRPVRVAPGRLEIGLEPDAPTGLPGELARKLEAWTGTRWMVLVSKEAGDKPIAATARERRESLVREARDHPAVKAVLERFPGAEIVDVRDETAPENSIAASEDETD
ncbi:MAG: DNA polymerase III subunit gamma/tau [Hyphomicrobiales bacterium]